MPLDILWRLPSGRTIFKASKTYLRSEIPIDKPFGYMP